MGCHVAKIKQKIVDVSVVVADTTDTDVLGLISQISSLSSDIITNITNLKELLMESHPIVYNRCAAKIEELKNLVQPWSSYQELFDNSDAEKIRNSTVNITKFDEASAFLFFTTVSQVIDQEHIFCQQTHAFLCESFNKGRLTNFSEKYQTLSRFQERLQFKFGKSCSYLMRGVAGAGKGKKPGCLSLREYVDTHNFCLMHPNSVSRNNPSPDFDSQVYKEEVLTAIDLCLDLQVSSTLPGVNDNKVFLVNKATDGMALKPALRYSPQIHRIVGLENP